MSAHINILLHGSCDPFVSLLVSQVPRIGDTIELSLKVPHDGHTWAEAALVHYVRSMKEVARHPCWVVSEVRRHYSATLSSQHSPHTAAEGIYVVIKPRD